MRRPLSEDTDSASNERRLDLDRLRVLACLSTFVIHGFQVFDSNPYYHIKSGTRWPALDIGSWLMHAVRMPLFFLIAGMVGYLVIQRLGDRDVVVRRAARLLPPFLLGVLLLTPWIKYIEVLDGRSIDWRGITLITETVDPLVNLWRYFTRIRWFSWSHMWFPFYLLLISLILHPVLRWMQRTSWQPRMPALVLAVPLCGLVAIELALRPYFPWHIPNLWWDWASMSVYIACFLSGAALMRWPVLEETLRRGALVPLALAGCGAALYLAAGYGTHWGVGRAFWLWGVLCLAIGLGPWLAKGHVPGERYLAEAVLPLYVLHHLPLVLIGYAVKDLPWPVWQRLCVIVLGAMAATLAVYHLLVRPFDPMRLALGMPRRSRA